MKILDEQKTTPSHPLEPLSVGEVEVATSLVKQERSLGPLARIVTVALLEPPKAAVLGFTAGDEPCERRAKVVVRERARRATYEAVVSLTDGRVVSFTERTGVQPPVMFEEFLAAEEAVRADPRWQAAMRRRGFTDSQMELAMVDPWSAGHHGPEDDPDAGRFMRPLTWMRSDLTDNGYARPIEGLIVRLDLDTMQVVDVEDHGEVPVPVHSGNYDAVRITDPENVPNIPDGPRTDLRSIEITQPQGTSFEVDGHHIRWQKWDLRVGFTAREGLVLHLVSYRDGERLRPVMYRASLSEMFVPYGDTAPTHYRKLVMDEGEYGIGLLTNSLELGCDCLGEIRYLDGVVNDNEGRAVVIRNAICLHEEDTGILWKHTDFRTGVPEVRRSRRLVLSSIATVGNYEYGFYWYLYQDGSIQYEIKMTGIISTGAVSPGQQPRHGVEVAPGVYGPHHQHFFNVRLDMAVDGPANRLYEVNTEPLPPGDGNPTGNAWVATETLLGTESDAKRVVDPLHGRYWKISNDQVRNDLGQPVAYRLVPGDNVAPFFHPGSPALERAKFVTHHLWATAYDPEELFATGEYPNQHPGGDGLPAYTAGDRPIVDTDLVVWYTFGINHLARPEDWPVMPVMPVGFRLLPAGFFSGNPGLDVPPPVHGDHCRPA